MLSAETPPPQELAPKYSEIIQTILEKCKLSVDLKDKKIRKLKDPEAQEDKDVESKAIYEGEEDISGIPLPDVSESDDDDEWDYNAEGKEDSEDDSDEDELEESTLYNVCEVLFVKQKLEHLQKASADQFSYMINLLNPSQQETLTRLFDKAEQLKQIELQNQEQIKKSQNEYK